MIFLTPPPLRPDDSDFFELRKKLKFDDPPPSDLIGDKIEIEKMLDLGTPHHQKAKHKLKTLKIA